MRRYILEKFDSRNSSFNGELKALNGQSAMNKAQKISKSCDFPIIVRDYQAFVKYEQGEKTEWSVNALI